MKAHLIHTSPRATGLPKPHTTRLEGYITYAKTLAYHYVMSQSHEHISVRTPHHVSPRRVGATADTRLASESTSQWLRINTPPHKELGVLAHEKYTKQRTRERVSQNNKIINQIATALQHQLRSIVLTQPSGKVIIASARRF